MITNTADDSSFYKEIEAFYNDNPALRAQVESSLSQRGASRLPMMEVDLSEVRERMVKGLEGTDLVPLLDFLSQRRVDSRPMLRRKISSGVSPRPAPLPLSVQMMAAISDEGDVVNYAAPRGQGSAIQAIRTMEGMLVGDEEAYPEGGIYILEGGGTNGIYNFFQFVKSTAPDSEILTLGPGYFQFFEQAREAKLPIKRVVNGELEKTAQGATRFLPSVEEVERSLTPKTRFVIATQPANPSGEAFSKSEIQALLQLAEERDFYIFEDAAFEELAFDPASFVSVAAVAREMGLLDRVIATTKSFSKGKNAPGTRIGTLLTTNPDMMDFLDNELLAQRDCPGNLNSKVIIADACLRFVERLTQQGIGIEPATRLAQETFPTDRIDLPINTDIAQAYTLQRNNDMAAYRRNYEAVIRACQGWIQAWTIPSAAYNFMVLPRVDGSNLSRLAQDLFLQEGVETQWGPNFDNSRQAWQSAYGPWMRITFSSDPAYLEDSVRRIQNFTN